MKTLLKDLHHDIERYLEEDCYCPNEVYDVSGFFYMLVYADSECELLGKYKYKEQDVLLVATVSDDEIPILLTIWINGDRVSNMERYDLTEHNIKETKAVLSGKKEKLHLSEFDKTLKEVHNILKISDAICID